MDVSTHTPTVSIPDRITDVGKFIGQAVATAKLALRPQLESNQRAYLKKEDKHPTLRLTWIVLLLVLGLGGASYSYFFNGSDNHVASNTDQATPKEIVSGVNIEITVQHAKQGNVIVPAATESSSNTKTHEVKKGDTLWDIAEKYVKDPFRYPELAALSKIKNPDLIYPGDIVRIKWLGNN